jgi:hypothetical protein
VGDYLNVRIERFKAGRHRGVDGRYFHAAGSQEEVILQCKHHPGTPIEQLIRHLGKEERPKILRLNPKRYLLALSHSLSRADKIAIAEAFSPYVLGQIDIVGRNVRRWQHWLALVHPATCCNQQWTRGKSNGPGKNGAARCASYENRGACCDVLHDVTP